MLRKEGHWDSLPTQIFGMCYFLYWLEAARSEWSLLKSVCMASAIRFLDLQRVPPTFVSSNIGGRDRAPRLLSFERVYIMNLARLSVQKNRSHGAGFRRCQFIKLSNESAFRGTARGGLAEDMRGCIRPAVPLGRRSSNHFAHDSVPLRRASLRRRAQRTQQEDGSSCRLIQIPYTPMLFVSGVLFGKFSQYLSYFGQAVEVVSEINPHGILMIFLPVLIFESGFNADWHIFKKQFGQTFILAFPCVFFGSLFIMLSIKLILQYEDVRVQKRRTTTLGRAPLCSAAFCPALTRSRCWPCSRKSERPRNSTL